MTTLASLSRSALRLSALSVVVLLTAVGGPSAGPAPDGIPGASAQDPRWGAIERVFGRQGEAGDGYFRVEFPRGDLHVRIGQAALDPEFEFTTYFGFVPGQGQEVTAIGEVILTQSEVDPALAQARRLGVRVMALHNHLIGEEPRILYMHVMAQGPADSAATKLRTVLSRTATPLGPAAPEAEAEADWSAVDAVLGKHGEAEGRTAEWVFARRESHTVHGIPVKSSGVIETASEVVFQRLPGGQVATTGELYVLPTEVEPVLSALEEHGLHATALHNHMLDERPSMYWIHWYATGDAPALARGVEAALARMNSARRAEGEG